MNTAEWILVAILSITLLVFLIIGIVLLAALIKLTKEAQKVVVKSQDIAESANSIVNNVKGMTSSANGIVKNVKGMTSVGGTVGTFVDKYITPKLKDSKEAKKGSRKNDEKK